MAETLQSVQKYIENHDTKRAEIAIARLLRQNPTNAARVRLLLYRARVRLLTDRPGEATQDLHEIGTLNQQTLDQPEALELLADANLARFEAAQVGFTDRADIHAAQGIYERILTQMPKYDNNGWVQYQLGRIHLMLDQVPDAQNHFRKAMFMPSHVQALTAYCFERLGFIAYYEARQPEQAQVLLVKATQTYPDNASKLWLVQVYTLLSRVLRRLRPDEATSAAREAVHIAGNMLHDRLPLAEALFTLAETLSAQPDRASAVIETVNRFTTTTKTPLGVDVTWSRIYEMLGDAYYQLSDNTSAIAAYENVLTYNPDHPMKDSVQFRIASAQYNQGDYQGAIDTITTLLTDARRDGQAMQDQRVYYLLGDANQALGQHQAAKRAYAQLDADKQSQGSAQRATLVKTRPDPL
jgi:tetratricopeptide (TPR) repeat protein